MTEEVKAKVEHLKEVLDALTPSEISKILCGERPKRQEWITPLNQNGKMDIEDFKIIRKTMNDNIKNHLKGRQIYSTNNPVKDEVGKIIGYKPNKQPYIKPLKVNKNK
jgi:hypothetical protein